MEDFDLLEATTPLKRGIKNPRPSIVEDFDPPEAKTVGHRGSTNPRPLFFEDFDDFRRARGNDGLP